MLFDFFNFLFLDHLEHDNGFLIPHMNRPNILALGTVTDRHGTSPIVTNRHRSSPIVTSVKKRKLAGVGKRCYVRRKMII
jgi:hypothetical protein